MDIVDLVPRWDSPEVSDLIADAVYDRTPFRLRRVLYGYAIDPARHLIGFERDGVLIGLLGLELGPGHAKIRHIAVQPAARGQGVGREMVRWLVETAGMTSVVAETDRSAVGFYRRLGFRTTVLEELYPGTERFHCELGADLSDSVYGQYR